MKRRKGKMMQGNACYLGISILNSGGTAVEPVDVQDVEIAVGNLRKTYLGEELTFSGGLWLFPLSQGESFALRPGPIRAQVRVAWANGVVEGCVLPGVYVDESISEEVL
jgi:hypothetical protein